MKNIAILVLILFITFINSTAQSYFTKNGKVSFFSAAPFEDIKADNNQVISIINGSTGDVRFSLLNNAFHFKNSVMEVHFNESYIESAKYPKSSFKGRINDLSKVNFTTDGSSYPVVVSGELTIHGVTNKVSISGTISVSGGVITGTSKFKVNLADYKISIPKVVKGNIAEVVDLDVSCVYEKKI
jgi:hypothetical protein